MKVNNSILEVEEALLGLMLVNQINNTTSKLFIYLNEENFSNDNTRKMFTTLSHFYNKKNSNDFDIKLIAKYAQDNGFGNQINLNYINYLISNSGFLDSFDEYINQIREFSSKIKIKDSLEKTIKDISVNKDSQLIIDNIRDELNKIEERTIVKELKKSSEIVDKVIETIFSDNKNIKGIKTGFHSLDRITSGLQNGDLIILAARPSVGKTAFALNLAANIAMMQNKIVSFFSLEMPAEQLIQRMLSATSFVDLFKVKNPINLDDKDKEKLMLASEKIKNAKIFIDDSGSIKLEEIIWKSRRQKQMSGLDLIIIDYLQLIPTNALNENRQYEVSKISRSLKQLARELEVPIIALSQLNRRVETRENKKPMMSDLRESGAIEQDADIVAFLYREDYYNKDKENVNDTQITELNLAKHRNGSVGTIELSFNTSIGKFFDYKKDE